MKTHALKQDGTTVCGMNPSPGHGIAIGAADAPDASALEKVTCRSCQRLVRRNAASASPEDVSGTPQPLSADDAIRAVVREEIALGIEQLLRVGEAADVLAVSKKTVLKLLESKELALVTVTKGKKRITASSIEAFIRRNTA